MEVQEYRDYIAAGNPVVAGSDAHLFMHQMAQEAIRIGSPRKNWNAAIMTVVNTKINQYSKFLTYK